jgi:hypothetical protein
MEEKQQTQPPPIPMIVLSWDARPSTDTSFLHSYMFVCLRPKISWLGDIVSELPYLAFVVSVSSHVV